MKYEMEKMEIILIETWFLERDSEQKVHTDKKYMRELTGA